jgi:hypothetical protein
MLRVRPPSRGRGAGRRPDLDAASGGGSFGAFTHRDGRRSDRCGWWLWRRRLGWGRRIWRARRRWRRRLGIGLWCGRRLGRRRREGGASRRKERKRVDVGLARADADTEVDVRDSVLGFTRRAGVGDDVPLGDRGATPHAHSAEVCQRHLGVAKRNRDGQTVRRDLPRERDLARDRRADRGCVDDGDVDAAVLTCGVRVTADGEAAEDSAVGRPRPSPGRCAGDQRPAEDNAEADDPSPNRPRCPSSEHATTVPRARAGGNAV